MDRYASKLVDMSEFENLSEEKVLDVSLDYAIIAGKAINKNIEDLTELDKFSICFRSGADITVVREGNSIMLKTIHRCKIKRVDDKYIVIQYP